MVRADASAAMSGGPGNDEVAGAPGNDILSGGAGDDFLDGDFGDDAMDGGLGWDEVGFGNPFYDTTPVQANLQTGIATGWGTDSLSGVEELRGTKGNDVLIGDAGPNAFQGWKGDDVMQGGDGQDTVSFRALQHAVDVDLMAGTATGHGSDTLAQIENVTGTWSDDTIIGDAAGNVFLAGGGDDVLAGGDNDDVLDGQGGHDTGDGGPEIAGDVCRSIEAPTSCES